MARRGRTGRIFCSLVTSTMILATIIGLPTWVEITGGKTLADLKKRPFSLWKYSDHSLNNFLKLPFPKHFSEPADKTYSQAGQDVAVYHILKKKNGFFVELGAFNGKNLSNTIWLERKHNWTGLLIEANRDLCENIDMLGRNAWRLCACISNKLNVTFIKASSAGGVQDTLQKDMFKGYGFQKEVVPCFRLEEVLSAIKVSHIDYFSLDVEGGEFEVLETLRNSLELHMITVSVWTIEYKVYDGKRNLVDDSKKRLRKMRQFFKEIGGYFEHSQLDSKQQHVNDGTALDVVFVLSRVWCETHSMFPNGTSCNHLNF